MTATTHADRTLDALLRAVIRDPHEDLPRLAYADRLEELGETDRAEFIRVQIRMADLMPSKHRDRCNCKGCQLRRRERELQEAHSPAWLAPFAELFGSSHCGVERGGSGQVYLHDRGADWKWVAFRRGFVASVSLTLADLEAHGEALFRGHPLEAVALTCREPWDFGGTNREHGWWRESGPQVHSTASIPDRIWDVIESPMRLYGAKAFHTTDAALAALSTAVVQHYRGRLGLPALEPQGGLTK